MHGATTRILLVEDNPGDMELIREALREAREAGAVDHPPFELHWVDRLASARARLEEGRYDVVLLDLSLPDVQGLETFERIHPIAQAANAPVVVLSGLDDSSTAARAVRHGAQDYLIKGTVGGALLTRSILYAIERSRAQAERLRLERERSARAQAQEAQRRVALLADAGEVLAASLDVDAAVRQVARLVVPALGDLCSIVLVDEDGALRDRARAPDDDAACWREVGTPSPDGWPGSDVVRLTLETKRTQQGPPAAVSSGLGSLLATPLVARARALGVLALATTAASGRRHTPADVALAEDLARRIALAIDNIGLLELARRERQRAEDANRAKDEFLATLSHELRTPLSAILGWAHMLRTDTLLPKRRDHALATIERNARAQTQLIDDLLDVSRIVTGKLRLSMRPVDVASVVRTALEAVQPAAEAKGVQLVAELDPSTGPIAGDPERLQQVVWNLASNAVKFTPTGGRVVVRLHRQDSEVTIAVEDTGRGIAQPLLEHVFDRFWQADSGAGRATGGLGLGLAIVRHLVELHGGAVIAHSEGDGRGATFTVRLPARPAERRTLPLFARAVEPSVVALTAPEELRGARILCVDDEADAREILCSLLEACGAETIAAAGADSALSALREHRPHVVLSDVAMPGRDGYALIRQIRELGPGEGGHTPAIALTAFARAEDRMRALLAGFDMHVSKPIDPTELLVVVASLLDRARAVV